MNVIGWVMESSGLISSHFSLPLGVMLSFQGAKRTLRRVMGARVKAIPLEEQRKQSEGVEGLCNHQLSSCLKVNGSNSRFCPPLSSTRART